MRKLLILLLLLLLILPALVGAGSRYLAGRVLETGQLPAASVDWRGGWLSSEVTLGGALYAQLESAQARLQHGPLLLAPVEFGWLRMRGSVFPRAGGAIPVSARLGLLGDWRVHARLLPTSMSLDGSLALSGRVGRDAVAARLNSPSGRINSAAGQLSWHEFEGRGEVAAAHNPLAGGTADLTLDSATFEGSLDGENRSTRIQGARLRLDWPRSPPQQLRLELGIEALERGPRRVSKAALSATIDSIDRNVLAQILQQLPGADLDRGPRGALAINLATLAGRSPQIDIERLNLSTPHGDFQLTGPIGIRPGGLETNLRGQVPVSAMHHILSWWYADTARARQVLDQWIMNGRFRRQDGMLEFEWVVNR